MWTVNEIYRTGHKARKDAGATHFWHKIQRCPPSGPVTVRKAPVLPGNTPPGMSSS